MQKGLHIEVQTSNIVRDLGLFTEVYMDQQRLQQVLSNLIQNSIKYSYDGVIFIKARCIDRESNQNDNEATFAEDLNLSVGGGAQPKMKVLEIRVRDQGIGLKEPEQIGKMFNRLDVKDNVNQNGIGFGLTISKMLVEQLGGSIMFRNHTNFDDPKKTENCFGHRPLTPSNHPMKAKVRNEPIVD